MKVFLCTKGGISKPYSEDRVLVGKEIFLNESAACEIQAGLIAVADGVGGNRGGAVAAYQVCKLLSEIEEPTEEDFVRINQSILEQSNADERKRDMATTLTGICITNHSSYGFHVGNTRLYTIQAGEYLKQETSDDTVVEYLLTTGQLSPEEAISYPKRNEITACLGGSRPELMQIKLFPIDTNKNPLMMITCDGIHETLSVDDLEEIITEDKGDWELIVERIVQTAVANGSTDDCSVVVIDCLTEETNGAQISQEC